MNQLKRLIDRMISPQQSILAALKKMDHLAVKSLAVSEDANVLYGVLSIGDIQRAIIGGISLDIEIQRILRPNPRILSPHQTENEAKEIMVKHRMEFLPVVDAQTGEIIKAYFWSDFFPDRVIGPAQLFDLPVVIMAGGLGSRLKPLTSVLPKPLIPLGEKTIIEDIFARFNRHGCSRYYISVNYKADLIEYYLRELNLGYEIKFFKEDRPLGTAGSLSLLRGLIDQTFFVSNCDIIIEQDYSEILLYHKSNKNELTVVSTLKHYPLPYGIVETRSDGIFRTIIEKPELTFQINAGFYILEPHLLNEIPLNEFLHITDLIEKIKNRNGRIGVFPVSQNSWIDIGTWDEYLKIALNR